MPADKEEATRVVRRSKNYVLVGDKLYRRAASSGVLLKCISFEEGKEEPMRVANKLKPKIKSKMAENTPEHPGREQNS